MNSKIHGDQLFGQSRLSNPQHHTASFVRQYDQYNFITYRKCFATIFVIYRHTISHKNSYICRCHANKTVSSNCDLLQIYSYLTRPYMIHRHTHTHTHNKRIDFWHPTSDYLTLTQLAAKYQPTKKHTALLTKQQNKKHSH